MQTTDLLVIRPAGRLLPRPWRIPLRRLALSASVLAVAAVAAGLALVLWQSSLPEPVRSLVVSVGGWRGDIVDLAEARHAHELLESAASKGKLVLVP